MFNKSYHSVKSTIFHGREAPFRLSFSRERKPQKERGPTGENRAETGRRNQVSPPCFNALSPFGYPPFTRPAERGKDAAHTSRYRGCPREMEKDHPPTETLFPGFFYRGCPRKMERNHPSMESVSFRYPIAWHLIGSNRSLGWHISDKPRASERILYFRSKPGPFPEA